MFGFLRKKPPEIQFLLTNISKAINNLPDDLLSLGKPLLEQLENIVKHKWKPEHEQNYAMQVQQGETHEAFIYNYLVHLAGDQLESGQHHVYRGVLGVLGNQYKCLFEHAIDMMIKSGYYTQDWANTNLRAPVYKGIMSAG